MNSVTAILGRFNDLSNQLNKFQHENEGKQLGRQLEQPQQQVGQSREGREGRGGAQVSLYEVSYSFSSSSSSSNGARVLQQELQVRFEGATLSKPKAPYIPEFEPPSPDEVAANVLGFVEGRIQKEAASGASSERLDNLLSQAREGVEKGFGQAREQIEQMGMMTEELDGDIDKSFNKINDGLDRLTEKYVSGSSDEVAAKPIDVDADKAASKNRGAKEVGSVGDEVQSRRDNQPEKESAPRSDGPVAPASSARAGYSAFSGLSERAAIQITTQDGDVISFNVEQIQASFEKGELSSSRFGFESTQMMGQYQEGQYSYSIDGELDEGEIQALNDLMVQIEGMSDQFFSGDFQGAFQSALELGFDSEEIAGFTVNLSQTKVEQVSAYEQVAELGEGQNNVSSLSNRFEPLSSFFDSLQAAFDKANTFSQPQQLVSDLFDRVFSDRLESEPAEVVKAAPYEQMQEYMEALIEQL